MNAKDFCEICKKFDTFMFTDCGQICENCWNKEIRINDWNFVIDKCVKLCNEMPIRLSPRDCANAIMALKKETHLKEENAKKV